MNNSKEPEWLLSASDWIIEHINDNYSNSTVSGLNDKHGIKYKITKMEKLQINVYFALSNQILYFLKFAQNFNLAEEY